MDYLNKNNAITLWRIVFSYVILFFHFDNKYALTSGIPGNRGWYIGVEFFFVVSGFLLYSKLEERKEKYPNGLSYLGSRVVRIYPYYLASFILSFIGIWICAGWSFREAAWNGGTHLVEALALQGAGLNMGWNFINNTGWFISVLFISEFLLYHCLVKWKDTTQNFVIPIVVLVCFSFLYRYNNGIGAAPETTGFYENWGLMRGLLDMSMGVCAARINKSIVTRIVNTQKLRWLGHFGFVSVLIGAFFLGYTEMDFIYLIVLTVSVSFAFLPANTSLFRTKFMQKWSGLTLSIYLIHDLFRTSLFPKLFGYPESSGARWLLLLLYMVAVTAFAIPFKSVITHCIAFFERRIANTEKDEL